MPPKKQKVLQQDDEPKVKKEPGAEEEEAQPRREAQGVVGGDDVIEALVASNSRLCAQAFAELERARVAEADVQQVRSRLIALEAESKARISALEAESKTQASIFQAEIRAKNAEVLRLQAELARRDAQPAAVTLPQLQQHLDRLQQQLSGQAVGGGGGGFVVLRLERVKGRGGLQLQLELGASSGKAAVAVGSSIILHLSRLMMRATLLRVTATIIASKCCGTRTGCICAPSAAGMQVMASSVVPRAQRLIARVTLL